MTVRFNKKEKDILRSSLLCPTKKEVMQSIACLHRKKKKVSATDLKNYISPELKALMKKELGENSYQKVFKNIASEVLHTQSSKPLIGGKSPEGSVHSRKDKSKKSKKTKKKREHSSHRELRNSMKRVADAIIIFCSGATYASGALGYLSKVIEESLVYINILPKLCSPGIADMTIRAFTSQVVSGMSCSKASSLYEERLKLLLIGLAIVLISATSYKIKKMPKNLLEAVAVINNLVFSGYKSARNMIASALVIMMKEKKTTHTHSPTSKKSSPAAAAGAGAAAASIKKVQSIGEDLLEISPMSPEYTSKSSSSDTSSSGIGAGAAAAAAASGQGGDLTGGRRTRRRRKSKSKRSNHSKRSKRSKHTKKTWYLF